VKNLLAAAVLVSAISSGTAAAQGASPTGELAQIRAQLEGLLQRVDRLEQQNTALTAENAELKAAAEKDGAERDYLKAQTQDLRKDSAATNAALSGLRGAEWAQRITLKGDLRYRHEEIFDDAQVADGSLATADRYRDRIRVRAGLDARPTDNILVSVQLATSEGGADPRVGGDFRSSNQTLDGSYSRKNIYLDQAYFDWKFSSWGSLMGGKMRTPFVRTGQEQFYDGDINPEGLALQFNRGMWFGSVYGTWVDEVNGAESTVTADALLNGVQIGARVPVGGSTLMLMAHYYDLVGGQGRRGLFWNCTTTSNACANGNSTTGPAGAGVLTYDFNVLQLATQWNTTIAGRPFQAWGQYAENLDPSDLNTAWAAGVLYGAAANYRTWEAGAMYQVVERDALFGQLIDSDFGGGTTDSRGFVLRAGYAPVRNWIFNATYFINERNVDVGTRSDYDRLQVDMNLRF
jgi:uncharacterized protein (UPF0335 family)